jgi:hypothetical protein
MSSSSQCQTNTPTFLDGWLTLPDELKLRVISFALPFDARLLSLDFSAALRDQIDPDLLQSWLFASPGGLTTFNTDVLPLLACPELRHMAYEAFYKPNTIVFSVSRDSSHLCHPTKFITAFMRRIRMLPDFETVEGFAFLIKVGKEDLCGANLHRVELFITGVSPFDLQDDRGNPMPSQAQHDGCSAYFDLSAVHQLRPWWIVQRWNVLLHA